MRYHLIVILLKSLAKKGLSGDRFTHLIQLLANTVPNYVAIDVIDLRHEYDDDPDMDDAHNFGINKHPDKYRILN